MSTFKGIVAEFPQIRIDYFRTIPGQRPPLACFLSHIHSDHLQGLESLKSPFVYCSPASREVSDDASCFQPRQFQAHRLPLMGCFRNDSFKCCFVSLQNTVTFRSHCFIDITTFGKVPSSHELRQRNSRIPETDLQTLENPTQDDPIGDSYHDRIIPW